MRRNAADHQLLWFHAVARIVLLRAQQVTSDEKQKREDYREICLLIDVRAQLIVEFVLQPPVEQ